MKNLPALLKILAATFILGLFLSTTIPNFVLFAADAPPTLVASEPENGASWQGEPVTLSFDKAMAAESADYLVIWPELAGETTVDDNQITFTPSERAIPGQRYSFTLAAKASAADGTRLVRPVTLNLEAATPLQVTSTQPSDGATEIDIDTSIVVVFNRPVVPLTGFDEQADLPPPLRFEPPVEGTGEWINTSIYAFEPTLGLAGGTDYSVRVDDIVGFDGEALEAPVSFSFATTTPIVLEALPTGNQVDPDSKIIVHFSQPMDVQSTEAALRVTANDVDVSGATSWSDQNRSLTFVPDAVLPFGATVAISIDNSAMPASLQGSLRNAYTSSFTVVPLPAVLYTSPRDDQTGVPTDRQVTISFSAPLSPTTVLENITVSPTVTNSRIISGYNSYISPSEAWLSWNMAPYTTYTVTVGRDIIDLYGNSLGEESSFSFTTGDHSPFTRVNLPERFNHFTASSSPTVNAFYRNMDRLTVDLFELPMAEFDLLAGQRQWEVWQNYVVPNADANRLWSRDYLPDVGNNVVGEIHIEINDAEMEPLPPGIYLLEMNSPFDFSGDSDAPDKEQHVIVLSDDNLTLKRSQQGESLVWKTTLATGEGVADAPIELRVDGTVAGTTTTDENGIAVVRAETVEDQNFAPTLAVSGQPGEAGFAVVSTDWNEGIGPWEFELSASYGGPTYQTYVYTDRPIYRPDQTVYWKGIIRAFGDDGYDLPPEDMMVTVVVRDDRGNEIDRSEQTVNEMGTINGDLFLAPEATSGFYYIDVSLPGAPDGTFYGGVGFQVASYRPPEFEVTASSAAPEYLQGETATFEIDAAYFSGGPLADAPVDWRLVSSPYSFVWQSAPDGRYFSFQPYNPDDFNFDPYRYTYYGGLIQEGTGVTDKKGTLTVDLPAELDGSPTSQNWRFDATVQSSTNQFVNDAISVPVHRAEFVIGLSPRRSVTRVGEESIVDVVTLEALGSPDNAPYPDAELDVTIYEFVWNSVYAKTAGGAFRWENDVQRTPVYTATVTTDAQGMGEIVWSPGQGGQYQIEASGVDSTGNEVSSATYVWAAGGDEPVTWRRENHDRIELVADKALYEPGERAQILVPNPFSGQVDALVTIERDSVLDSQIVTLESNDALLDIPITSEHIPNMYVSVVLIKGLDETNPTPAIRVGYVELAVDASEKELDVDVESVPVEIRPGDVVSYTLTVRDMAGDPMPNAEVSVAVVDKAVLSLATTDERPLIDVFYYRRGLGVQTGALLIINHDRLSQQLTEGAKGGGGGGGFGPADVRQEFADLAAWHAELLTDENGQITFDVTLPDNLTNWVLIAKAVTADTQVGDAMHEVVATQPLQIRPLLPRFLTGGDRARIGAVVVNASQQPVEEGQLTVSMDGVSVESGELVQAFRLEPGEQARFDWTVLAASSGRELILSAAAEASTPDGERHADAVQVSVPVNVYETHEIVGTSGTVPEAGRTESIIVPDEATDSGALLIGLEASLAAGMIDGLDYLAHYPYECNEQTVSRFLPNLFTMQALRSLQLDDAALADQLAFQLGSGVQRLTSRQNPDGGWGYWPGEESSPFITSYVLWGLSSATELGYTVPQSSKDAAVGYLERSFIAPTDADYDWQLNEMAFTHFVLSEMGEGDPGRVSTLYDVRERLALYGKAYLAMALANMNDDDARVQTLLDDLFGAVQYSATGASWHETQVDFQTLSTDTRTTAIVLAAFLRLDPEQPMLEQVVRWLMSARQAGRWATTQENAWSIIALTDWLETSGELEADYSWQVTLNEKSMGDGRFDAETLRERVQLRAELTDLLRDQANVLQFGRDNDSGQLYYTTHLRYAIDALAVDARDRGVVVGRRFENEEGDVVDRAGVGEVISVTTTIIAPADRHHLLVEVAIPAGTEVVDVSLATESDQYGVPSLDVVDDETFGRWTPSHTDIRDEKVALFATNLPAGTYEYTFQIRALVPGEFRVLPVHAEQMYFPEVWGRSAGQLFMVSE